MRFLLPLAALLVPTTGVIAAPPALPVATTIDGARIDTSAEQGHVVIVNFWATWCAPCRIEMPALDAYYRAHQADGLTMVAITTEQGISKAKARAATAAFVFRVARIDDTRIARADIPSALPTTRVYGRDGRLRWQSGGQPLDAAALERVVTPLLVEKAG